MRKLVAIASVFLVLGLVSIGVGESSGRPEMSRSRPRRSPSGRLAMAEIPRQTWREILGTWIRVSTDGRKDDRISQDGGQEGPGRPRDDVPAGAGRFVLRVESEGGGWQPERVLLDPSRIPMTIDFFPRAVGAPRSAPESTGWRATP